MCQNLFLKKVVFMETAIKMMIIMMIILIGSIWVIIRELIKIEKKISHPDEKPKNERRWGWGKHRD